MGYFNINSKLRLFNLICLKDFLLKSKGSVLSGASFEDFFAGAPAQLTFATVKNKTAAKIHCRPLMDLAAPLAQQCLNRN